MYRWQFFFSFMLKALQVQHELTINDFNTFRTILRYIKNHDSIYRIGKTFYQQAFDSIAESLSSDGFGRLVTWFILWTTWQNLSIDCGELVTSVSVQCWSRKKYFDGLPNASLEHALLPREDRRGGHLQEGPDNFGWSPTVVDDAVVMTTCSLKLTPKGLSCLQ